MVVGIGHFLSVAAVLFVTGIFGVLINRKSVLVALMSVELMLLAVNINFVAFSAYLDDLAGQVFSLLALAAAAAEAAVGLAILVVYHRNRSNAAVDEANSLKG